MALPLEEVVRAGGWRSYWRAAALVLILAVAFLLARTLPLGDWLKIFNEWVQRLGFAGVLIFAAVYSVATVLLVPGSLLTLGAGAAFGLTLGFVAVSLGSTAGAALAFVVSRYLVRRRVERWIETRPRFSAVDRAVGREGWKIVLLTRLSPVFPFNFLNYAYGLTPVPFWHYALASWIGMIPGTLMYVYLGTLGRVGLEAASKTGSVGGLRLALNAMGLAATVLVTVLITRMARKALREAGI